MNGLDFHTANAAEPPRVVVYDVETGDTVAEFLIQTTVGEAEIAAADFIARHQRDEG